jgi:hypothetical protein
VDDHEWWQNENQSGEEKQRDFDGLGRFEQPGNKGRGKLK